jgi:hypothetical protein
MNAPPPTEGLAPQAARVAPPTLSRLLRRIHMFSGLFLAPWMLMYALSTLVMTHREFVLSFYPSKSPSLVTERALDYTHTFPTTATREQIGEQVLRDLALDGSHYFSGGRDGKPLIINRQHALAARRITFDPANHKVVVEREEFRVLTFLERMHRRRGYHQPYVLDDTWGATVDVTVVVMVFWSLSGIWLWWELKSTRGWGAFALMSGVVLFATFLVLL